jgi:D-alanyl-D-alanine carboxypeptidase/D-alanyl-D-alanine-endopeptidase (penicillin-binding protein 4)
MRRRLVASVATYVLAGASAMAGLATAERPTAPSSSNLERRVSALPAPSKPASDRSDSNGDADVEVEGQTEGQTALEQAAHIVRRVDDGANRAPRPVSSRGAAVRARLAALEPTLRPAPEQVADDHTALTRRLAKLVARAPRGAHVSVHVRDLDTGAVIFDHAGDTRLNPASNTKVVTAMAAVELLGPEYRFSTKVFRDGSSLVLVGGGDPSLQPRDLWNLAATTAASVDLQDIDSLVIDDSMFSAASFGPGYDPDGPGESYQAPSGALSLSFNTIEVVVRPTAAGTPVDVEILPAGTAVHVINSAKTGRGELTIDTRRTTNGTEVVVSGGLRGGHAPVRLRRRIHDPATHTAATFASLLAKQGAPASLPIRRGSPADTAVLVAEHHSQPLPQVLSSALRYSNNFTSEQVLRTLAHHATGEPGDFATGTALLHEYWAAIGGAPEALDLENGSGLSRRGRFTARGLVDLFSRIRRRGSDAEALLPILAHAGGEGTLRSRNPGAGHRVRAKTGTLGGVSTLSGVVESPDGERMLGFAILVNGTEPDRARPWQDALVRSLLAATRTSHHDG